VTRSDDAAKYGSVLLKARGERRAEPLPRRRIHETNRRQMKRSGRDGDHKHRVGRGDEPVHRPLGSRRADGFSWLDGDDRAAMNLPAPHRLSCKPCGTATEAATEGGEHVTARSLENADLP
jgi:hypothetical protein